MAMPTLAVEIAFGDAWNVASPTWVDVTAYVRDNPPIRISRGRERVSRPRPGTLTVTLGNNDRRFDPDYTSGPYANDLKPMVPIRVTATHNSVTYALFRGFVSEWRVDTTDGKDSTATVTAVDGLSVLELLKVGATYESEITADSPVAWWKLDETSGTNANNSGSGGSDGTYQATPTLGADGPMSGMVAAEFAPASSEYVSVGATTGTDNDTAWTVEGWAYADPSVASTAEPLVKINYSAPYAMECSVYYLTGDAAGDLRFRLLYPTSSGSAQVYPAMRPARTTWFHWAVTFTPGNTFMFYLNGVLMDTLNPSNFDNTKFTGTMSVDIARSAAGTGYFNGRQAQVAIYGSALAAARIAAHAGKTFNGFASGLTSARATAVLDLVGWPSADRTIATGLTTVAANTASTTALGAIWEAVDSEDSECFISGAGKVVFTNRDSRGGSSISAIFSNDGSDTPYQGLSWARDDSLVRTVIAVTDSAGDTLEVTDSTNEAVYGPRTLARTTYTTSATEPTDLAYWLLGEYKDALTQVEVLLEAGAGTTNAIWSELLSRELGDLVNVEVKPVGGTSQNDWDMFVEQIDLTAAVDLWSLRLGLSNAQGQGTFTLDNAVFGQLDGPGRLGF